MRRCAAVLAVALLWPLAVAAQTGANPPAAPVAAAAAAAAAPAERGAAPPAAAGPGAAGAGATSAASGAAGAGGAAGAQAAPLAGGACTAAPWRAGGDPLTALAPAPRSDGKPARHELGSMLRFKATGELGAAVCAEFAKPPHARLLRLHLDGIPIGVGTERSFAGPETGTGGIREITFGFDLERASQDDTNRTAWDRLLRSKRSVERTLQAAVVVGNNPPVLAVSAAPIAFQVASATRFWVVLTGGIGVFIAAYLLMAYRSSMLQDAGTGFYSLGKAQLAFWGLLVLLSFACVWIITGTMERIPAQTLTLLGISGATGLAAAFIGGDERERLAQRRAEVDAAIAALDPPGAFLPPAERDRERLRLQALLAELRPQGFWRDIVNDGNGPSFHRAQVVGWTLVLGVIFVNEVAAVISMPEFPETLLALMGISNVTYLGFKVPESGKAQRVADRPAA